MYGSAAVLYMSALLTLFYSSVSLAAMQCSAIGSVRRACFEIQNQTPLKQNPNKFNACPIPCRLRLCSHGVNFFYILCIFLFDIGADSALGLVYRNKPWRVKQ